MTMTLEQVRDWFLARINDGPMQRSVFTSDYQLRQMADAIDAHLRGAGESVATLHLQLSRWDVTGIHAAIQRLPCPPGEYPLYAAPQHNIDVQAVREVMSELRSNVNPIDGYHSPKFQDWSDKLEAAIGGKTWQK